MKLLRSFLIGVIALPALVLPLAADEGLWPYNQFPRDAVKEKYMVDITPAFLDNLRLASAKIPGGSASFVSANGLMLTNQHLVAGCLGKLSTPQHDYRKDGFYAATQAAEPKCEGIDASVLTSIDDVTAKVKAAAKENEAAAKALEARNGVIAKLEKECSDKTPGTRCSVVKLFAGGRYDLYTYKVYGDLRLVFAPENELAQFGHQRDAVTYLRYGLDVAFLRAYEGGKPAATPHFLKWSADGVRPGEVVFAAANPEITSRAITAAELKYLRDSVFPLLVARLRPIIDQLATFSAQSDANKTAAEPALDALLNQYKFTAGKLIGLRDDRMVNRKTTFENKIKRAVENDPKLGVGATKVWDDIQMAYRMWSPNEKAYELLENSPAPGSTLFQIARQLVRNGSLDAALQNAPALNDKVEVILLTRYLEDLKTAADKGEKDIPIKALLSGKTPAMAAEAAVMGTTLKDPAARAKLSGGAAALKSSEDPIIKMALLIDAPAKTLRKRHDDMIGSLETSAEEKIAGYRFRLFGATDYPDATGTPRVEFGVVKGYTDRAGTSTPPADSFGGLFYRTNNEGPYEIPPHWVDLKSKLNLEIPLDFVSTCDVGGGDYGSPVVNAMGELVGVTFDGNLESMPDTYLYSDEQARAVHVSVQGIAQALGKAYNATALLTELGVAK